MGGGAAAPPAPLVPTSMVCVRLCVCVFARAANLTFPLKHVTRTERGGSSESIDAPLYCASYRFWVRRSDQPFFLRF